MMEKMNNQHVPKGFAVVKIVDVGNDENLKLEMSKICQ